jgi:hypothetical protein
MYRWLWARGAQSRTNSMNRRRPDECGLDEARGIGRWHAEKGLSDDVGRRQLHISFWRLLSRGAAEAQSTPRVQTANELASLFFFSFFIFLFFLTRYVSFVFISFYFFSFFPFFFFLFLAYIYLLVV